MKQTRLTPIALASLFVAQMASAQAVVESLETIEVRARPIIDSQRINPGATLTTVVSSEQIKDLGALDLAAGLRLAPGVQISRYNEVGSYSGDQGGNVYIRGLGTSRPGGEIKTYLDGLPVYMGLWNHPLIDLLPLNGMERIEVHKGPHPQSSGNNFASINLISKSAKVDGIEGEATASLGAFSTRLLQGSLLGKSGPLSYMVAAGHTRSDGDRDNADAKLNQLLARVSYQLNGNWQTGATLLDVRNEVGDPGNNALPTSSTPLSDSILSNGVARNESSTRMVSAFLQHTHGDWRGELKVYRNEGHNDLWKDASWGTFDSGFKMTGLRWHESASLWAGGKVSASLERDSVSGDIAGPHVGAAVGTPFAFGTAGQAEIPSFTVSSLHLGAQHNIQLNEDWTLQPSGGARYYDSNHYASKWAPHLGLQLVSETWTWYANRTTGLLYPGAETYTLTRAIPMAFAADNGWDRLSPSENQHTELGVSWQPRSGTQVDLSWFKDNIKKRYVWSGFNPFATGVWSNNYPDYRIEGVEAALRQRINDNWALFGSLTTLDSSVQNLPYAPDTAVSMGITGQHGRYRLALDAQLQSSMYTLTQDRGMFNPGRVDSFCVANARVAYAMPQWGKKGEVFMAINNLGDTAYQYNQGYPMAGRHVRFGITGSF